MTSFATITSYLRPSEFRLADTEGRIHWKNRCFTGLLSCMALLAVAIIGGTLLILTLQAWPVLREAGLLAFVSGYDWHPTAQQYGLVPMIAGTFMISIGALVLAGPFGVTCAVLTRFYATDSVAAAFRVILHLLAGIPSVVYGLWGLTVLVPWIAALGGAGPCVLAGTIILGVMVLPTVAVIVDTALHQQSPVLYQSGIALGLPRYRVLLAVVLPAARNKLIAAGILGLARALGETMAVLMVTGNAINLPTSLLSSTRTLSANIALEMAYALNMHRAALFATGLILMLIVLTMLAVSDHLENHGVRDA
jgi:phosphate transport system permease protein